jgi:hypothetical protein
MILLFVVLVWHNCVGNLRHKQYIKMTYPVSDDSRIKVWIVLLNDGKRHFHEMEDSCKESSNQRVGSNKVTDKWETLRSWQSNGNIEKTIGVQVDVVRDSGQTINENFTGTLLRSFQPVSKR